IVFHISNNKLEKYTLERFGLQGSPYPVHGIIYYQKISNQAEWPAVWRWSGTNFEKIEKSEARSMLNSFSSMSELLAKEGWNAEHLLFATGERSFPIALKSQQFKLVLREQMQNGGDISTALILGRTNNSSEEILAEASNEYRQEDRRKYLEIFK